MSLLTIELTPEQKAALYATAKALGMAGMGAVVRAIMDGRLPPIPKLNSYYVTPRQQEVFQEEYDKYITGQVK